jgi:hypothetical protein
VANLFWISAAQVYKEHGPGPYSAANLLAWYGWTFARADAQSSATFADRDGIVRTAAANELRLDWVDLDGDGVRESPGFILEGQRKNELLRSEEFDNGAWSATTVTVSANVEVAPDGTTTGDRLIEGALSQEHVKYQTLSGMTANVNHSSSVFAKKGTRDFLVMTIRDLNSPTGMVIAWFNLNTGAVGTVSNSGVGTGAQGFIVKYPNGWYRCILIGACNASDTTPVVTFGVANANGTQIYTGDGVSYISLWGAQFENNTKFPSSYIKNVGTALTRVADAGPSFTITDGPRDLTIWRHHARPIWADTAGTGTNPQCCTISTVEPYLAATYSSGGNVRGLINANPTDSLGELSFPTGTSLSSTAQFKNLQTGGQVAVDVGSGLGSFASAATAFSAFGNQTVSLSISTGGEPFLTIFNIKARQGLNTLASMATEPSFAPVGPFEVTDLDIPGPLISKAQSGRVNTRSTQQIGATWTEHYLLQMRDTTHREFLTRCRQLWRNGTIFAKGHVDYGTMKGVGGGVPLVKGASQTGSTLIVDGCPLNTVGWLLAGDIFRVQGLPQVLQVAADVNTEGDGRALIPLVTPIFSGGSPSDNAGLTITGVTLDVVILEPPALPSTSGTSNDYGEFVLRFTEAL